MTKSRRKKIAVPIHQILLDDDGAHLIVEAKINETKIRLLIDTGASKTVFDRKRMRTLMRKKKFHKNDGLSVGLGTSKMKSHFVELDEFSIGELVIENFRTVLLDLKIVNKSYAMLGLEPIDGVLGGDILKKFSAEIYYGKQTLVLFRKK